MESVPGIAPEDPCTARDWLDVCLLLWSSIFLETILWKYVLWADLTLQSVPWSPSSGEDA